MKISKIRVVSPTDAGCEISESEHLRYCAYVEQTVSEAYGCTVECELADVFTTTVYVHADNYTRDVEHDVRALAQEVWEQGCFWD